MYNIAPRSLGLELQVVPPINSIADIIALLPHPVRDADLILALSRAVELGARQERNRVRA